MLRSIPSHRTCTAVRMPDARLRFVAFSNLVSGSPLATGAWFTLRRALLVPIGCKHFRCRLSATPGCNSGKSTPVPVTGQFFGVAEAGAGRGGLHPWNG